MGTTLGLWAHASVTPHVHGAAEGLVLAAGVIFLVAVTVLLARRVWSSGPSPARWRCSDPL